MRMTLAEKTIAARRNANHTLSDSLLIAMIKKG